MQGWAESDASAGLAAFRRSCEALAKLSDDAPLGGAGYAGTAGDWRSVCATADMPGGARAFFETNFVPYRVIAAGEGFFTGYYEPELKGSRTRHGPYQTPLYGVPSDLIGVDLGLFRENLRGQRLAGRVVDGRLVPYATRAEIAREGLPPADELLYVDDPVDAFFLQVQGSGRVLLDDGSVVRAAYAGQNGHTYTAIGAVLVRWGELQLEDVSMQSIRAWIAAHPERREELFDNNASYVFFSAQALGDPNLGANGTQGVPLTPEASIAVDATTHPLGAPMWLETMVPDAAPFRRLVVAQDTGGAIRGVVRADIYWGFGARAGEIAGRMRSTGSLTVLLPRGVAERLGAMADFPGAVS